MANLFLISSLGSKLWYQIMLGLDGIVYWFVNIFYVIFYDICSVQLFSSSTFTELTTRIYAILGIVMLFVVAFQLLTMVVDPEKITSGDTPVSKIALNIVLTIIILTLLPTGFKYLYRFQQVVISENIIGKIILGENTTTEEKTSGETIANASKELVLTIYDGFIYPQGFEGNAETACLNATIASDFCVQYNAIHDISNPDYANIFKYNSAKIRREIDDGEVRYQWLFSAIAGGFVVYLLITFCIDIGVRVVKLAYFQLIAPIPVAMRIIPKQNAVFDNWFKGLTKTFLDLFIRLMIIFLCVYLITLVPEAVQNSWYSVDDPRWYMRVFVEIALIFGILLFMKEAPKLISTMFNLGDSSIQLGIGKKLSEMPLLGKDKILNPAKLNKNFNAWRGKNYQNRILKEQNIADNGGENRLLHAWNRGVEVRRHARGQESLMDEELREANIKNRKTNATAAIDAIKSVRDTIKGKVMNENSSIKASYNGNDYRYTELQAMMQKAKDKNEAVKIQQVMAGLVDKKNLDRLADIEYNKLDGDANVKDKMNVVKNLAKNKSLGKEYTDPNKITAAIFDNIKTYAETDNNAALQEEREIKNRREADATFGKDFKKSDKK